MTNLGGSKCLTKKFIFTQTLHELERIRAILKNFSEISKIVFHF